MRARMCERKLRRVEGVTCYQFCAAAVEDIPKQGMSEVGEVHADLVGAPRFKL